MQDLYSVEQAIIRLVKVKLNQNQFDALCSLIFNIGISTFNTSTLLASLIMAIMLAQQSSSGGGIKLIML